MAEPSIRAMYPSFVTAPAMPDSVRPSIERTPEARPNAIA